MRAILHRFKKESSSLLSTIGFKTGIGKVIGLDIGHTAFRAARINETGKDPLLKDIVVGNVENLKDLNRELQIQPDERVSINFHGDNIAIRQASIPVMPREEIRTALKWQLKDNVQFDIDSAKIKFDILGERQDRTGAKKIDVVAIVYREGEIERHVERLRGLGLNVSSVFLPEFALAGYARHLNVISSQDRVAIVDIGSKRTNIAIVENGKLCFSRDIAMGGDDITEAMTGILVSDKGRIELSREEAEKIKCEQGIPSDDINILSLMRPVLEKLAGQIKRSLEYCEQISHCSNIENIILAGNGAKLKGLREYLSNETGLKVLDVLPESACCAGLSLVSDSDLNIIPERFIIEKKNLLKYISLRMVFVVAGLLFLISYGFLSVRVVYLKNETNIIRQHWENIKDMSPIKERIVGLTSAIGKVHQGSLEAAGIMRELSHITPNYVMLDNLSVQKHRPNINISGIISKGDRLTQFMDNIEGSMLFENVKLKFSRKIESYSASAIQFELAFDVIK